MWVWEPGAPPGTYAPNQRRATGGARVKPPGSSSQVSLFGADTFIPAIGVVLVALACGVLAARRFMPSAKRTPRKPNPAAAAALARKAKGGKQR